MSEILRKNQTSTVDLASLTRTQDKQHRWIQTLKNQIAVVLFQLVEVRQTVSKSAFLNLKPIDQIECEVPNIQMLKMMDSTDNGSDGVGQLLQEVIDQSGLTAKEFSSRIQVLEGDLGTCLNFHGLHKQREPTKVAHENLENILLIPGAGHTLWNISQAILLHHWGDPNNMNNFGAWQMADCGCSWWKEGCSNSQERFHLNA